MKKTKPALLVLMALVIACSLVLVGCGGETTADTPAEPSEWEKFLDEYEEWIEKCEKVAEEFDADPFNTSLQEEVKTIINTESGEWKERFDKLKEELSEEEIETTSERVKALTSRTDAVAKQFKKTIDDNSSSSNSEATTDWNTFLDEYEAWVDSYIVFMEKYLANPADTSLLSDYTKLAAEMISWSTKAEEMQQSLSPEEAAQYSERLVGISEKLNAVAQNML